MPTDKQPKKSTAAKPPADKAISSKNALRQLTRNFETVIRAEIRIAGRLRRAYQRHAELVKQRLAQPLPVHIPEENTSGKNEAKNDLTPIPAMPNFDKESV